MNRIKRLSALLLVLCLLLGGISVQAAGEEVSMLESVGAGLQAAIAEPTVSTAGGEWAVLGLARSGLEVPAELYENYWAALEELVIRQEGVIHSRKYTEYSRVVLALTAMGKDPRNVAGYDLLAPLGDYEKTVYQGINGAVWALIALDAGDYEVPVCPGAETQATRELYLAHILDRQMEDGGFSLSRTPADPDVTAMALVALAPYTDRPEVAGAAERAVACLSGLQRDTGDFVSWGGSNSGSAAQVLIAMDALEIELTDPRFVKNGNTVLDGLLRYRLSDGSFCHTEGGGTNLMATEQALMALSALQRQQTGGNDLFDMNDAGVLLGAEGRRHPDVKALPVIGETVTFRDVEGHPCGDAVLQLARRGIIDGMGDGTFSPDSTMTRAQFAAIITRALGLSRDGGAAGESFTDVPADKWYADWIRTANGYGLVSGRGNGLFDPEGTITRQEAAIMASNAAALCGLDPALSEEETAAVLAACPDGEECSAWARNALAAGVRLGLLEPGELRPRENILRGEIAVIVYRLLERAELLA